MRQFPEWMILASSLLPYTRRLRQGVQAETQSSAADAMYLFRGGSLTVREAGIFDAGYDALNPQDALAETAKWAAARTSYLAFGQP